MRSSFIGSANSARAHMVRKNARLPYAMIRIATRRMAEVAGARHGFGDRPHGRRNWGPDCEVGGERGDRNGWIAAGAQAPVPAIEQLAEREADVVRRSRSVAIGEEARVADTIGSPSGQMRAAESGWL